MACGEFNPQGGVGCYDGNIRGISFLAEAYQDDKSELAKASTWDALAIAGARTILDAPDNEKVGAEPIVTSLKFTADVTTGKKEGSITLKFIKNDYTKSILAGLGSTANVFFHTDKDVVIGLETSVTDERKSIKVAVTPIKEVNGDLDMVALKLTILDNNYDQLEKGTALEDGFLSKDIPSWTGLQLGYTSSLATELVFYVQDIAEVAVEDATAVNFTLWNVTDDVAVTLTGQTLVGNVMTLTFATLTGKSVRPSYATPTLATDLYNVQKTFTQLLP